MTAMQRSLGNYSIIVITKKGLTLSIVTWSLVVVKDTKKNYGVRAQDAIDGFGALPGV